MSGGGGAPANTTQTTELPKWAQPYATSLLQRGAALSEQPMPVYGGQRSADMNDYQTTGMDMVANRALNGSSEIMAGSGQLQDTLGGGYLGYSAGQNPYMGENPYLQSMIDKSAGDITKNFHGATNSTDANFARSGAFGGSAWANNQQGNAHELAQGLRDSSNGLRMQNYQQSAGLAEQGMARDQQAFLAERSNQMAGLPLALQYGNQAYADAAQLQGAGGQQYAFDQQQLTDQMNQFNDYANAPYKSLDVLGNSIRGAVGGGSTVSQSGPGQNTAAQAVGAGAALYGMFGK